MIRENDVRNVISNEIPALAISLALRGTGNELYKAVTCLSNHTKELIKEHKSSEVIECFHTADELFHEGTSLVKFAIVNIYISSVSRLLEYSFCPEQSVRAEFLKNFGTEYYKLIYAHNP